MANFKITRNAIDIQFNLLCELTNKATSEEQAIKEGKTEYFQIDHTDYYGGYRIDRYEIGKTVTYGAFGFSSMQARKSTKEFYAFLCDTNTVLTYLQNNR